MYAIGALVSAVSPNLVVLILGNSILEGVGTALLIPPVYKVSRRSCLRRSARVPAHSGLISALGGIGAAAGPRSASSPKRSAGGRVRLPSPGRRGDRLPEPADQRSATSRPDASFDVRGAILSATAWSFFVMGILAADDNGWLMISLIVAGTLVLVWFFLSVRAKERAGEEPLPSTSLFRNRTSNLA